MCKGFEAREEQDMSQCLRCSKPCEATSVFCDNCQSLLRSQLWQAADTLEEETVAFSPIVAVSSDHGEVNSDPLDRITSPLPIISKFPLARHSDTPLPLPPPPSPSMPEPSENGNVVDYALQKLNEAAQSIAQVEQGNRRQPRASRLSPIRDISADIQRHSTPLPQIKKDKQDKQEVFESHPANAAVASKQGSKPG